MESRRLAVALALSLAAARAASAAPHCAVFMYHRFGDERYPSTSVTLEQFESHLAELKEGGFQVWPLGWVIESMLAGKDLPDKCVALTVDDAYGDLYKRAFPLLREKGFPFTLFLSGRPHDAKSSAYVTWDQIREMQKAGMDIGNHSYSHPSLLRRGGEEPEAWRARVRAEIEKNQKRIVEETGVAPRLFAYPYGEYEPDLQSLVKELGFVAAFGQHSGPIGPAPEPFDLPRFAMAEAYGGREEFRTKARTVPLPIKEVQPAGTLIGSVNPPLLTLRLNGGGPSPDRLRCYAGGQGAIPVVWADHDEPVVQVQAPEPLRTRRGRYNCTAYAGGEGRFYWFSRPWFRSDRREADDE